MTPPATLTETSHPCSVQVSRPARAARFAVYGPATEPPTVEDVSGDAAVLIEALFARTAGSCSVPAIAVREIVENLVHADFAGACVSVLDGGATVRVSDQGPGIDDKTRALRAGFSTATDEVRAVVRGVGSGLPVAAAAMHAVGGDLDVDDNLSGGTVVTLSSPVGVTVAPATELTETSRRVLAVMVEVGTATAEALAAELSMPLPVCGRELMRLEHRELVTRQASGIYSLTTAGETLVSTLF